MRLGTVLVTGGNGFIGSHLIQSIMNQTASQIHATYYSSRGNLDNIKGFLSLHQVNVSEGRSVLKLLNECQPNTIFHLAAASNVPKSWGDPQRHFDVNVKGTINLLEAVRSTNIDPKIVVSCSSAEYARTTTRNHILTEDSRMEPSSPYAISKVAQDFLAEIYASTYGLKAIRVRPFLIVGPGRADGACADFARGIVEIERGLQKTLKVGNLNPIMDFLDVRDAPSGLLLLASRGKKGEVYNLCSGKGYAIRRILEMMLSLANTKVKIVVELKKLRAHDEIFQVGDNTKLRRLGWRPRFTIEQTLEAILDYWRAKTEPFAS